MISLTSSTGIFKLRTCTHRTISQYTNARAPLRKLQWEKNGEKKEHTKQNEYEQKERERKKETKKIQQKDDDDNNEDDECNIKQHTKYKSTKAQSRMKFRIGNKK